MAYFPCLSARVHHRLTSKILPTPLALQPAFVATSDGTSNLDAIFERSEQPSHFLGSAEWRAKAAALPALNNDASSFHPSATNFAVADELATPRSGSVGSFARASRPATKTAGCSLRGRQHQPHHGTDSSPSSASFLF